MNLSDLEEQNPAKNKIIRKSVSDLNLTEEKRDINIHLWLTLSQIGELHEMFLNHPKLKLSYDEFREALVLFNLIMSDAEYKTLFLKINQNYHDNSIDWDEFVSYMIFCYQEDDPYGQKETLNLPISTAPDVKNSKHTTAVVGITLIESLQYDDDEKACGSYLSVSRDGLVNFWSPKLEVTRSGISRSQYLKFTSTWILGIIALSDVRIVCISSTERELRFYDVVATNFNLRLIIRSVPNAIGSMNYVFDPTAERNSKLLMGDLGGSVRIIEFSPKLRGPFQSKPGASLIELTWKDVLKGKLPGLLSSQHVNIFPECVQQIYFSYRFQTLYAAAESHDHHNPNSGVLAIESRGEKSVFHITEGVTSFFLDEKNRILATGGPDTFLRLWHPLITNKPTVMLAGHQAGIVFLFIQPDEKKVYTIDLKKIIKVWHVIDRVLLQTFADLTVLIPNETQLCYMYNKFAHELMVGGRKIISIKCCPKMQMDLTDGNTHVGPVSVVLYNKLFENIVTCGLDSCIIVWDPWTGKRQIITKKCHTMQVMGEILDVEITAGCFDPMHQFLLTGARDGSLKIWNYNNAVCIHNMNIEQGCEVTTVFWVVDRILVIGWNHRVTEFGDMEGQEYGDAKNWVTLHDEDVTAASYRLGETLITGSYSGELIFWKLETGQPYRKYLVKRPKSYVKLILDKEKEKPPVVEAPKTLRVSVSKLTRKSVAQKVVQNRRKAKDLNESDRLDGSDSHISLIAVSAMAVTKEKNLEQIKKKKVKKPLDASTMAKEISLTLKLSIQAIIMLNTRPMSKEHGTVLVALENGMIQVYSHHQLGGYMGQFYTIHKTGDCVLSMTTDKKNKYLFTGTAFGYIKIWLLTNYCVPESEKQHIIFPLLRLQFIFMSKDRILGRAKRVARDNLPILLSSYKGHIRSVTSIVFMELPQIVITGSHDFSVRMWSLGGRYLGTLGGMVPWKKLIPNETVNEQNDYRVPPDINKVGSFTTMKVLTGKVVDLLRELRDNQLDEDEDKDKDKDHESPGLTRMKSKHTYGKPLPEPLLGKHFKFDECGKVSNPPLLDKTLPYIPVYAHLRVHKANIIERPPTPTLLKEVKNMEFMDHYYKK